MPCAASGIFIRPDTITKVPIPGITFCILVRRLLERWFKPATTGAMHSPLKQWFDGLKSGKGPCCSDDDGFAVSDPDWESKDGRYRVRVDDEWVDVPDNAVITEPNRNGQTMVWPTKGTLGTSVRCFMPGIMT